MARPTKLTPETQDRICQAIKAGATYEHACARGGISYSTFRGWILRGEAELERVEQNPKASVRKTEVRYVKFSEAVKEAESDGVLANLLLIRKAAGDGTWQAAAWLLERRHPEMYGRRVVDNTVRGDEAAPLPVTIKVVREDKLPEGTND